MAGKMTRDTIPAKETDIGIRTDDFQNDLISLTDPAKRGSDGPDEISDRILRIADRHFQISAKAEQNLKVGPLNVKARIFEIEGSGSLSLMTTGKADGSMFMETAVVNLRYVDLPLLSCDRIYAAGSHTVLTEYYDTTLSGIFDQRAYGKIKDGLSGLPDVTPESGWYDSLRFDCSFFKRGMDDHAAELLDRSILSVFSAFFGEASIREKLSPEEAEKKRQKSEAYVDGLFEKGGPTAENFGKALGTEAARAFFHEKVFGTGMCF